ncbi:MAG TPA: TetR/AcrR family transcriptional regulator [Myxococcota bacterium]|nr:TetR/AcrR family transcriptional regulator [Myxococcota bacterium]
MVQNQPPPPEPKRRGRPRAYDPERALASATRSFWRRGFSGTSLDDLAEATGMNRPSLYGAFGDKRELYLTALDRYVSVSRASMDAALAADVPLERALLRVYDLALALYFAEPDAPLGCFLIGTAATEAAVDGSVREKLGSGLRELTRAFERRLKLARERGELGRNADPKLLADLAGAVLHSIALRARAGDSRESLRAFARSAVKHLCSGGRSRGSRRRQ